MAEDGDLNAGRTTTLEAPSRIISPQNRIIASLINPNFDSFPNSEIPVNFNPTVLKASVLDGILRGKYTDREFERLLKHIPMSVDVPNNPREIDVNFTEFFNKFTADLRHKVILLQFGKGQMRRDQIDSIQPRDLYHFLQRFPDPIAWEKAKVVFLSERAARGSTKISDLESTFSAFERELYGEKQEYWKEIKDLRDEAFAESPTITSEKASRELNNLRVTKVSETDPRNLLDKIEVHGDPFNGQILTARNLYGMGLAPKYKVESGESVIWLSQGYQIMDGRTAFVGYVNYDGGIVARSFYNSNSHTDAKLLPSRTTSRRDPAVLRHFNKGLGEASIVLPFFMQKAVDLVASSRIGVLKMPQHQSSLAFAGTARESGIYYPAEAKTFTYEVNNEPQLLKGNFYSSENEWIPPEEVVFWDEADDINYQKQIDTWPGFNKMYGKYKVYVFLSNDEKTKFLVKRDERNRVWISSAENDSPILSTGVRQNWIHGGFLFMTGYAYGDESGEYGNFGDQKGEYVDMFKNYNSKIPTIQRFLKEVPI